VAVDVDDDGVTVDVFGGKYVQIVVIATTDDGKGGFEGIRLETVEELELEAESVIRHDL